METHLAIKLLNLPMSFVNKILDTSSGNDYRLRSNILNFEQCDKWVNEFSMLTNTNWIVRNSNKMSERFVCRYAHFKELIMKSIIDT